MYHEFLVQYYGMYICMLRWMLYFLCFFLYKWLTMIFFVNLTGNRPSSDTDVLDSTDEECSPTNKMRISKKKRRTNPSKTGKKRKFQGFDFLLIEYFLYLYTNIMKIYQAFHAILNNKTENKVSEHSFLMFRNSHFLTCLEFLNPIY